MATADEILKVRNNTNTTSSQYDDLVVGELIDNSSINCASYQIWLWETAKIVTKAGNIKKASAGAESHEWNDIKSQLDVYQKMSDFYEKKCNEDNGEGTCMLIKTTQPRVGNIITQDEIDEYLS